MARMRPYGLHIPTDSTQKQDTNTVNEVNNRGTNKPEKTENTRTNKCTPTHRQSQAIYRMNNSCPPSVEGRRTECRDCGEGSSAPQTQRSQRPHRIIVESIQVILSHLICGSVLQYSPVMVAGQTSTLFLANATNAIGVFYTCAM